MKNFEKKLKKRVDRKEMAWYILSHPLRNGGQFFERSTKQ